MSADQSLDVALVAIVILAGIIFVAHLVIMKLLPGRSEDRNKHVDRSGQDHSRNSRPRISVKHQVEKAENFRNRTEPNESECDASGYGVCSNFDVAEERCDEKYGDDLRKCGECGFRHGSDHISAVVPSD